MKRYLSTLGTSILTVGAASAASITYDFSDTNKIVAGTYGTSNGSYSGPDSNTALALGIEAGAFTLADSRNQGTIGNQNGVSGGTIGGSIRAGISAEASDWTADQSQRMSFSVVIGEGADVDLTQISFQHGYYSSNGSATTGIMWYLQVVEGSNIYNYQSASAWTHDGGTNYQNASSPSMVALTGLTDLSNTSVTFTWGFTGQRSHNLDNQSNWIDNVELTVVPEPSSFILLSGALGLWVLTRRR